MKLKGKVALITGAGHGIGQAIAVLFCKEGADIAIADIDLKAAEETAAIVKEIGRKAIAIKTDVAEAKDVDNMVESTLDNLGRVDILINDAAIPAEFTTTIRSSLEHWDRVIDIGLRGTFLCSRRAGQWMVAHKTGVIVNFSSIVAEGGGFPNVSSYGSAKAGIEHMTRALAVEWGKYNIRVNCILPGFIYTGLTRNQVDNGEMNAHGELDKRTPLGRLGDMDEIAKTALFLVSDDASYITGVTLPVDGGWCAYRYI